MTPGWMFGLEMGLAFGPPLIFGIRELRALGERRRKQGPAQDDRRPPAPRPRPTTLPDGARGLPACLVPIRLAADDPRLREARRELERELA